MAPDLGIRKNISEKINNVLPVIDKYRREMELFTNLHELEWLPAGQPGVRVCGTNDGEDRVAESGPTWDLLLLMIAL